MERGIRCRCEIQIWPLGNPGTDCSRAEGVRATRFRPGLIDQKLASVISAYTAAQYKNCQFTPNYTFAMDNCLDSRNKTDNANNYDIRIDHHFNDKNTVFGRAYMMWDTRHGNCRRDHLGCAQSLSHLEHGRRVGSHFHAEPDPGSARRNQRAAGGRQSDQSSGIQPETSAGFSNLSTTSGFYLTPSGYPSPIGNVGPEHRANPESNFNTMLTWIHGKHNIRFGGEYLYENRLETNQYEQFSSDASQTCPTNASGLFACGSNQGNALASMLLDLPSALTVNVPHYEEVHVRMDPFGFFVQDEWHVRSNLTINVGLRYDYDPAVKFCRPNGETVNAMNLPAAQFVIGAAQSAAYTTGCTSPQMPPCVPGGLRARIPRST